MESFLRPVIGSVMQYIAVVFEVFTATYLPIYVVSQTWLDPTLMWHVVRSVLTAALEHAYNSWICKRYTRMWADVTHLVHYRS